MLIFLIEEILIMKKQEFELFLDELKLQVDFAFYSLNMFKQTYNAILSGNGNQQVEFWYYLQNYVVELANVSKILFISKKSYEKENAFRLRKAKRDFIIDVLDIKSIDAIKNKQMRNSLEHIDEKLEEFAKKDQQVIANRNIGPSNAVMIDNKPYLSDDSKQLRNYLTDSDVFFLFGKRFDVAETMRELIDIKKKIELGQEKLDKGDFNDLFDNGKTC